MMRDWVRLSKTMAQALRHRPAAFGLTLDAQGWVPIADLLAGLRRRGWPTVTEADLAAVLAQPGKQRYEMAEGRIRARYGHSIAEKIEKEVAEPPAVLYHGTAAETAVVILREGLKPMRRQYVHLSVEVETAVLVGRRKSPQVVVLRVLAAEAYRSGVAFYDEGDNIWLADPIAPQFLEPMV